MSTSSDNEEVKRGRGRPVGSRDSKKIKLKATPRDARERFMKLFGEVGLVALYGVDDFSKELVNYMWGDPSQEFVVCDPVEQHVANLTRDIGNRPYSLYRYEAVSHVGFIESGMYPVVVVAEAYRELVTKLPNPHNVTLVFLADL